jgi:hypothetical protein
MRKNSATDFKRACKALIGLFYADGFELVMGRVTGDYTEKSAPISVKVRMPMGLVARFEGEVVFTPAIESNPLSDGSVFMRFSPKGKMFPRMYAEYNDGSWGKLEWDVLFDDEEHEDEETDEAAASDH